MKSFSSHIRALPGKTLRETVLELMRIAGAENDSGAWTRLKIENPISNKAAQQAWSEGVARRNYFGWGKGGKP